MSFVERSDGTIVLRSDGSNVERSVAVAGGSVSGSASNTLAGATSTGSGTRTVPAGSGSASNTLAGFTSTGVGTRTVPQAPVVTVAFASIGVTYSIDLCSAFVRIGEATAYEFDAIARHLSTGEWQLTGGRAGFDVADVTAVDSIIVWETDGGAPARIVYAGLIRPGGNSDTGVLRELGADGETVTFSGVDLFGVLRQRIAWPQPSQPPPWGVSHDVRTGAGSAVAAEFIYYNAAAGAITGRPIPNLVVVDPSVGGVSTWEARLQPLDLLVGRVCRESNIACRASMPFVGYIYFTFATPADRSLSVLFSDQGDLEGTARVLVPAGATYVVGAGQGELTDRSFATASTAATGLARVERLYENTNITTTAGLASATANDLARSSTQVAVNATVSPSAAQSIRYLDSYDLGDWVGVEIDGDRYSAQVETVRFTFDAERQLVSPTLGRAVSNPAIRLLRDVSELNERFNSQVS